jgi:imidazolonepropionase-like amidohydrolase
MQRSLFVLAACAVAAPGFAADQVFKAKKVYTGAGVVSPGAIHVRDGKIVRVAESVDASAGAESIDLGDSVVMPGIVNFSTTLGLSGGDSEVTKEITPDFQPLRSVDWRSREFREARVNGVTTAGVFPGTEAVVSGLVSVVKTAGDSKAERVVKPDVALAVAMGTDPTGRNAARGRPDSIYMRQPTNRMGVVWLLRSSLQKSNADPKGDLRPALDAKLPFFCTARVSADVEAVIRLANEFGFRPVIVGGEEAYQVVDVVARSKTPVVLRSITSSTGVGPERTEVFWNQAGVLHKAGVTIAIAGDHPLDMARFAVRYGLPADAALQALTATPAKLLGVDGRVGTLAEGKDADFVVLSGEPFEFTTAVRDAVVNGRRTPTPTAPRGPLAGTPNSRPNDRQPTNAKAKTTPKG